MSTARSRPPLRVTAMACSHPLPEQHAIRQIGQRIVLCHMSDLGLGPALLGDVKMRSHPPAAGHWLSRHADQPTIRELVDSARDCIERQRSQFREELLGSAFAGVALEDAGHDAMPDDVGVRCPRSQQFRRQLIESSIALVADDKPLLRIEHAQGLDHVVDGRIEPEFLLLDFLLRIFHLLPGERELTDDLLESAGSGRKAAIRQHADEAHPEHRQGHARNCHGEEGRRKRQCIACQRRVWNDLHGPHGREMVRHDGERQQQRRSKGPPLVLVAQGNGERSIAQHHAEADRDQHQPRRPGHATRDLEGPHADIVHACNARADDAATGSCAPLAGIVDGNAKTARGQNHRRGERQHRQNEAVIGRDAGLVGEHRDKMRCPDSVADGGAGNRNPDQPRPGPRGDRTMKDADRNDTCNEAYQAGKQDETPIVLGREAGKNAEHPIALPSSISSMVDRLDVLRVNFVQRLIA
ncbi:hypothetical protein ACVIYH_005968 [Bradyrhizobium diazoefficiens]